MSALEDLQMFFPNSTDELADLLANPQTRAPLLAGGTDLLAQWAAGVPVPPSVISAIGIDALSGIADAGERIEIGANVTHARLRRSDLVREHLPALAAAAATVGGAQIQARGTLAGNVANASPAGDTAPALLITGGSVIAASTQGEREIPFAALYAGYRKLTLRPDEAIVRFALPKRPPDAIESFRKLGPRAAQAISKVMGAIRCRLVNGTIEECSIAFGSVAPIPIRLTDLEDWLRGRELSPDTIDEAARTASAAVAPIADIRSSAEYRKWAVGQIVRGFLEPLAAR